MSNRVTTDLIPRVAEGLAGLCRDYVRGRPGVRYADVRLEVVEAKVAAVENGSPRFAADDYSCAVGVRVLAGDGAVAAGYAGRGVGAAEVGRLEAVVREALERAGGRARANAVAKAEARARFGSLGASLADTGLAPVPVVRDVVAARFRTDPRQVPLATVVGFATDVAREVAGLDGRLRYSAVTLHTELARELFCSSEGALIDQSFALTQGLLYLVATGSQGSPEVFDTFGHQRGWEILEEGVQEGALVLPDFRTFARDLARDALALADAPPLPSTEREVVVVTDPHYTALLAHEIVGHPAELDRALKMELAYAGRSWLLRTLEDTEVGRPIASPLVTAFSDPALPGYGHYRYDHEGTPGRRVLHIDRGVFHGFLNSRQTAAILGVEPNGHAKASEAALVPLVRMSTTAFAPGTRDPREILREVEHGYYLVGHRIPSIAESREHFRISARKVYEIRQGEPGQLYRDGGIAADSRAFLTAVDAVGSDLRLFPIPNCGKGQPMQTKRLGNGGPTLRSRARLTGG